MDKVNFSFTRTDRGINLSPGRRTGKTTKIIDNAVSLLLSGKHIQVRDYEEDLSKAPTMEAKKLLLKKIESRLTHEHGLGKVIDLKTKTIQGQIYAWIAPLKEKAPAEPQDDGAKDLADLTKKELGEYLDQKGVDYNPKDRKAVLLDLAVKAHGK